MFKIAFWLSITVITLLSLAPVAALPPLALDIWDKAQHAGGFLYLAVLATLAFPQAGFLLLGLALVAYGGSIELAQEATGWRHGDLFDLLADSLGVAAGLALSAAWQRFRRPLAKPAR